MVHKILLGSMTLRDSKMVILRDCLMGYVLMVYEILLGSMTLKDPQTAWVILKDYLME